MDLLSCNDPDLIRIISELKEIADMRVTASKCLSSGFVVGTAAALGGLLLGPRGIALGGVLAGVTSAVLNEGQFRSVPDILMNDLTVQQQRKLANTIRNLLSSKNIMTVTMLSTSLTTEEGIKEALEKVIKRSLKELNFYV